MHLGRIDKQGFTLIELSIVLVIIGLIVGGILVGQELIRTAQTRATIAQIEKYNTAVNTFRNKFDALPGDLPVNLVTEFAFPVVPASLRSASECPPNYNGIIEGCNFTSSGVADGLTSGEAAYFWEDLSSNTGLIEGGFNFGGNVTYGFASASASALPLVLPVAKLGSNIYIYVWTDGSYNYFGVSNVTSIDNNGSLRGNAGIRVSQAYNIDKKIDDGVPLTGSVTAQYENWSGPPPGNVWSASASSGSSVTCSDSGGSTGAQQYSMEIDNGNDLNCGLSFRFQ